MKQELQTLFIIFYYYLKKNLYFKKFYQIRTIILIITITKDVFNIRNRFHQTY